MKSKNPIDSYFKRSLEKHETKVSPEVWEKVVAATESDAGRGMAWYFMRAAVVVLMISIGTWYIVDYPQGDPGIVVQPDVEEGDGNTNTKKSTTDPKEKSDKPEESPKATEKESDEEKKRKKVMPIMKQSQSRSPIYVNHEPLMEFNERELERFEELKLATIALDPEELAAYDQTKPSLKLKLTQPVTESAFYSEEPGTVNDKDLKTKLYAYANTQFDNIRNGRPVELPKTGKPQLQINLNRIFNN